VYEFKKGLRFVKGGKKDPDYGTDNSTKCQGGSTDVCEEDGK
jgi:hypothetical protein